MSRIYIKPIPLPQSSTNRIYYWFDIDEDTYDLSMLEKAWVNHPWPKLKNIALMGLCFNMIQDSQNSDTDISLKELIDYVGRKEPCMHWNNVFEQSFKNNLQKNRTTFQKHYSKDDFGILLYQILTQGVSIFAECHYELEQARTLGERTKVNKLKKVIETCDALKFFFETIELINTSHVSRNYLDQAIMSYLPKYEFKYVNDDIFLVSLSRKAKIDHANIFLAGQSLYSLNTLKAIKRNPYIKQIEIDENVALVNKLPNIHHSPFSTTENSFAGTTKDNSVIDVNKTNKLERSKVNTVIDKQPNTTAKSQENKAAPVIKQTDTKLIEPAVKPVKQQPAPTSTQPAKPIKQVESPTKSIPVVEPVEREKSNSTQVAAEVRNNPAQVDTPIKTTTVGTSGEKEESILDSLRKAKKLNPSLEAMFDISNWRD